MGWFSSSTTGYCLVKLPHKIGEFVLGECPHEVYFSRLRSCRASRTRGEGVGSIIRLDYRLRGKKLVDAVLHEGLHGIFGNGEGSVDEWGVQLTEILCDPEIMERIQDG